jgi:acyl-CoA thioesterase-1
VAGRRELIQGDGLHPNARGVVLIVRGIVPFVRNVLPRERR